VITLLCVQIHLVLAFCDNSDGFFLAVLAFDSLRKET
jgi:hypothetical protein